MNERVKDGGPAFPHDERDQYLGSIHTQYFGMSLRDWFAGQALTGILVAQVHDMVTGKNPKACDESNAASSAYFIADAMLRAREKGNDHE